MGVNEPIPERYYTPQQKKVEVNRAGVYEPTPRPESVYINENSRVSKNESCCLACLLACFLCVAVKGEDGKNAPK